MTQDTLGARLAVAVTKRLGAPASFVRWVRDVRTGADAPVFAVTADRVADASALGFKPWQFERAA